MPKFYYSELRQRAHEQAEREFQQRNQAALAQKLNSNKQRQRLRHIAGCFFFMAVVIATVVVVTAVFLTLERQRQQQQGYDAVADLPTTTPTSSIAPSGIPSFSPSITPSRSFSPSTMPSSMPTVASSWRQIGNSMSGIKEFESLGSHLGFSADGNTIVTTAYRGWNETHQFVQVRAYTYHNDTEEWKQPERYSAQDFDIENNGQYRLSPNGKFFGTFTGGNLLRSFALRKENDTPAAMFWDQLGRGIVVSSDLVATSSSLTDELVFAMGYLNTTSNQGLVHVYQFDANQSDWVVMGRPIEMLSQSMHLIKNKSTGTFVLSIGGASSVRTFRYEPDSDSWMQFGSELATHDDGGPILFSLSLNGETITLLGKAYAGIRGLRTYSYDAATADWQQLGKDLKDSSFRFGEFSLSANGKVLVATTQKLGVMLENRISSVYGQVHTWDFIANDQNTTVDAGAAGGGGGGGEWIQRGAALEVGTLASEFGYKIALSEDGNRLAATAPQAGNEQGVLTAGKVRVFEQ
jgi:hypothetical protein